MTLSLNGHLISSSPLNIARSFQTADGQRVMSVHLSEIHFEIESIIAIKTIRER